MPTPARSSSVLDSIEHLGNKLPEPAILFCWLSLIVIVIAAIGTALGWSVQPLKPVPTVGPDGAMTVS
ncbi:MAG: AbgT family transporter, partial [Gammaproteobacteria bacterium]|nr:AbgT family transporter [Gammaproteobacteria bacterium]